MKADLKVLHKIVSDALCGEEAYVEYGSHSDCVVARTGSDELALGVWWDKSGKAVLEPSGNICFPRRSYDLIEQSEMAELSTNIAKAFRAFLKYGQKPWLE